MGSSNVEFAMRSRAAPGRVERGLSGSTALERMDFGDSLEFDYRWTGERAYLALHQIQLKDGETQVESLRRSTMTDLRSRITYAPAGCSISGWSSLKGAQNGYVALTFDPKADALGDGFAPRLQDFDRPLVYFQNSTLAGTLSKIAAAAADERPDAGLYLDLLAMTAILELSRIDARMPSWNGAGTGALTGLRARRIADYIEANLDRPLTLPELADIAGLSKFHFVRAFRKHFGTTPHAYVVARRMENACSLLKGTSLPITEVGLRCGYRTAEGFAAAFRQAHRMAPSDYRRAVIGPR